jgi:hypothetical protein
MIGMPARPGQATGKTSQSKEYVSTYIGRSNKPEQYANIILKARPDWEILRLKDVGQVELGPQFFDIYSDLNGHPSAAIVLKQLPGWSAGIVIEAVKKNLEQIKAAAFPPGMNIEERVRPQADLAPDHREARGKMPDDACQSRFFRAARGFGFRRDRGFLRTRPGQDKLEQRQVARKTARDVHG